MSFLNPLFLLGLGAIAAPIIVHLVRRTKAPRVEFPSLMFVRRVPQRTIRRRQFTNLLLLLMRCLAFLLLVLAFVRPYFGSGQANDAEKERATVILFDDSFSLRFNNRFDQAKKRAATLLDEMRSGERAALVTFGQGFEVQTRLTADRGQLKSSLERLQPGAGGTDYAQALRAAEGLFKDVGAREKRIVLISDFQAIGRNQAEASYRLSRDIKLATIDLGEENTPNLAIADVSLQPLIYQAKYADKLSARIVNYSDEARTGVRVELQLNDHMVEKREIKIDPREATTVEFTGFNLNEGVNRGVIVVEGDNFPYDNKFNFTLRRVQQMKALAIETAGRGRSESFYLRSALTTGENLPFTLDVKTTGTANPNELAQYRVILINDAAVPPALAQSLIKFVEGGGGLILSAGPHTESAAFNQAFQPLPLAKLEEPVQLRGESVSMSDIKTDHPVFEVFRQSGRLSAAHVFGYHRATPNEKAAVIARYDDGSPALIEATHGSGKVLLFTSTFDSSWNDLPLTPTYLPFVRQMARHLGERRERAWNPQGQVFTVAAATDGTPPAVDAPSGERITERKQTPSGELIINAREPGFYRLRYPDASDFAAVNLDSRESDLTRLNVEEFVAGVTGADPKAAAANAAQEKLNSEELEARERWWLWLLLGALFLFVAEAVLARRMKMAKVIG
ncbi:MAG: VWA domain-containing protein [Blastocatellia bacterium]|nr:VWA domain-containing protein [Blastocatellia bacterium]